MKRIEIPVPIHNRDTEKQTRQIITKKDISKDENKILIDLSEPISVFIK